MPEKWKPVTHAEYSNAYEVSSYGGFRRTLARHSHKPHPVTGHILKNGYVQVELSNKPHKRKELLHRIVAMAFHGPAPDKHEVNHKNGNKLDNAARNLEWVTRRENILHSHRNGRGRHGEDHGNAKLNWRIVESARRRFNRGESILSLAKKHGVSKAAMWSAVTRKTWLHQNAADAKRRYLELTTPPPPIT